MTDLDSIVSLQREIQMQKDAFNLALAKKEAEIVRLKKTIAEAREILTEEEE